MKNKHVCIIFLKYPEAGRVKTRLGSTVGMEKAALIYKKTAEIIVCNCVSDEYDLVLAIDPADRLQDFEKWLGKFEFTAQNGSELGEKMENAFKYAFNQGYERCIVAGSDIPYLDNAVISKGIAALTSHDTVFGRADDGGYYLVGTKAAAKEYSIFTNMIWSTTKVLDESLKRLEMCGKTYALLDTLLDIDTEADLMKFGDKFV